MNDKKISWKIFEKEYEKYILELDKNEIDVLTNKIKRMCIIKGILFNDKKDNRYLHHIPLTLFPTPFPKDCYYEIMKLQSIINRLFSEMSNDINFLINSLQNVCIEDEFCKKLLQIYKESYKYPFRQTIEVGIIRSDYMIDDIRKNNNDNVKIHLVEYNTISCSFASHGSDIAEIHSELYKNIYPSCELDIPYLTKIQHDIAFIIFSAWNEYIKKYNSKLTCILFIVQENERNIYDHTKIEQEFYHIFSFKNNHLNQTNIPFIFYTTLLQLENTISVSKDNGILYYKPYNKEQIYEVALIYYRSCYTPSDLNECKNWDIRKMLELNRAIKLPHLGLQLAGCKKIQQLLSKEILSKYLSDENIQQLLSTYIGTYSLDHADELKNLIDSITLSPQNYVLKPQREGGGNNIYGNDILNVINSSLKQHKSLGEYILMEIIKPTIYKNYIITPDSLQPLLLDCISEIGIWGMFLKIDNQLIHNITSGSILRTKSYNELDGGVASGRAVLDSIILY